MIGLDTNVLARYVMQDDPRQSPRATRLMESLSAEAPDCRLPCRDPDDRKFLDLAVSRRTGWLLSKDRALLAARRTAARRFALRIGTPTDFYRWLDDGRPT